MFVGMLVILNTVHEQSLDCNLCVLRHVFHRLRSIAERTVFPPFLRGTLMVGISDPGFKPDGLRERAYSELMARGLRDTETAEEFARACRYWDDYRKEHGLPKAVRPPKRLRSL